MVIQTFSLNLETSLRNQENVKAVSSRVDAAIRFRHVVRVNGFRIRGK